MKSNFTLLLLLLLSFTTLYAQQDTVKRTTTTVIFGDASADGKASSGPSKYNANAVKLNLLGLFSGTAGLTYERELGSMFSIEVGGGLTFRNFAGNLWRQALDDAGENDQKSPNFSADYLDEIDEDYSFDRRTAKLGSYFTIMPRFYYQEDGFDGTYLGMHLQRRIYKFEAFGLDQASSSYTDLSFVDGPGNRDEFEKQTIIALCWGYNNVGTRTVLDFYSSIGINSINGERIDFGYIENPSGDYIPVTGAKMREVKKTTFFFEIGFRLGFWWD